MQIAFCVHTKCVKLTHFECSQMGIFWLGPSPVGSDLCHDTNTQIYINQQRCTVQCVYCIYFFQVQYSTYICEYVQNVSKYDKKIDYIAEAHTTLILRFV